MSERQGNDKPRTGFVIARVPTEGEAAFMEAVALYVRVAVVTRGPADVYRDVSALIERGRLGHIRARTLQAARQALPQEEEHRETWDRLCSE